MKKTNIVQGVRAIRDRVNDVKDRVIQYLQSIRETQDVHRKELSDLIDKRADGVSEQLSDLSKTIGTQADKRSRDTNGQLHELSKSVTAFVDKLSQEQKSQLSQLSTVQQELSKAMDDSSDRIDQHFSVISHLLATHHATMMTLLGAGSDEEKYKILPTTQVEFDILPILPQRPVVNVLDIGAMPFNMRAESYSPLQGAGICRVIGLEPDEESYQKMKQISPRDTFIQKCAGTGERQLLHFTSDRFHASLYEPDKHVANCFERLGERMLLEHKEDVNTVKLDDLHEVADVDLFMNDSQGAELDIFQNANKCLESAVVVDCNVEFVKLYKNQPLFADVDSFLRSKGFEFHKFTHPTGRLRHDFPAELVYQTRSSQLLWANAVYVRSMFDLEKIQKLKLLKLAVIMHIVYKSYDLTLAALNVYDRSFNTRVGPAYKKALMQAAIAR